MRGHVGGDLGALGPARPVPDEDPVEAGLLVGAGEAARVDRVDGRAGAGPALGGVAGADHAEDLDLAAVLLGGGVLLGEGAGHRGAFLSGGRAQAGTETVRAAGGAGADEADEAAVAVGVGQRLEPADQQRADAEVHVVEQRLGDLLVAADERRGVAGRAGHLGDRGPQALVVDVALGGVLEQPLRARRRSCCRAPNVRRVVSQRCSVLARIASARAQASSSVSATIGRRLTLNRGVAAVRRRGGPDLADPLADAVERLAPERVDVGVLAADPDRRPRTRRRSTPGSGWPGGPTTSRPSPGRSRPRGRTGSPTPTPGAPRQEVVGAGVAGGLVGEVAVALLVGVVAAGDHVHRHPARVEGVEGGVRARGQRRREEARAGARAAHRAARSG